jgi:flagellar assembly protein FliH
MSLSHKYEDFGSYKTPASAANDVLIEALEDEKLQSFEEGYQAGWDDAIKAQSDEKARVSAELGQSLQEISFTYHEALSKLTTSIKPIIQQVIEKLLPAIAREALSAHIVEQITDMLRDAAERPVEIVVAEGEGATISALVQGELAEPFRIVEEAKQSPGQAFVRIGQSEREIDLDAVVNGVKEATSAFFHQATEERKNG